MENCNTKMNKTKNFTSDNISQCHIFSTTATSSVIEYYNITDISYNKLYKAIKDFNPLIVEVDLFDVYLGDKLEKHLKSLAFHISYQSSEKTLSSQEVDNIQNDLVKFLKDNFSAKLRDF